MNYVYHVTFYEVATLTKNVEVTQIISISVNGPT